MIWAWLGFILFVLVMLALDLGLLRRQARAIKTQEALLWSCVWIGIALAFSLFIFFAYDYQWFGLGVTPDAVDGVINTGETAVIKYLTGYLVEKSLSVDNIFVIAMLFGSFVIPPANQHRVLVWGILSALIMRGVMIVIGAGLIARFAWILYVFGAFLILTGLKMLVMKTDHKDPNDNFIVRLTRRFFPVTDQLHGERFLVKSPAGVWMLTPLALALIMIEATDLIFAIDSIPAVFAITADPFLVFTSNVFAMLGLRALYFALAGAMEKFRYLKVSLALVLAVVGGKMLLHHWIKDTLGGAANFYLPLLVLLILALGLVASMIFKPAATKH